MSRIAKGSDAKIRIRSRNLSGLYIDMSEFDFVVELYTSRSEKLVFEYKKDEPLPVGCAFDDGDLILSIDNPNFTAGNLFAKLKMRVPDALFPDGYYDISSGQYKTNLQVSEEDGIMLLYEGRYNIELMLDYGSKGIQGNPGKSAYQIWLDSGYAGTEQDFLDSFKGASGQDGANGIDGQDGTDGIAGKSAFQSWLDAGNTGSEQNFLDSFKGVNGQDGTNGRDGQDGTDGIAGKSAFQSWLDAGNTGAEQDFLDSLEGKKGEKGDQGTPGSNANVTKALVEAVLTGKIDSHNHNSQVSSLINTHNSDATAHSDIRSRIFDIESGYYNKTESDNLYQQKESGKGLYPDTDATKLAKIEEGTQKNKPLIHKAVTLETTNWTEGELFTYTIADSDVKDGCMVYFSPDNSTYDIYVDACFRSLGEATDGSFSIYAENKPTENINLLYTIAL